MNSVQPNKSPRERREALLAEKRASSCTSELPCSACRWDRAQLNDAASAACLALGLEPAEHYDLWSDVRWALVKHDAEKSRQNIDITNTPKQPGG